MGSWLARGLGLVVVLGLCAGLGSVLLERRAQRAAVPPHRGRLVVAGVGQPVSILRDRRGIPHADARSDADAYFALGFVHAQDRLSQMLWLRRQAQGRVSEVVGEAGLAGDRRARVLGFAGLAARDLAELPEEPRSLLEAYAAGVNARLERITSGRSPAPRALAAWGLPEAPWSAADSLTLLKHHAWALAGSLDESLVLADLVERFGGFDSSLFFPRGAGVGVLPAPGEGPMTASADGLQSPAPVAPLRRRAGLLGPGIGSSVVVVGGRHTRSGRPLLVADSHLAPTAPALLHQSHLRTPGWQVAGAAIPGIPVFWSGFNGEVAWASSHAGAVVTDLVVESLREGPPRYHDGSGWSPLEVRREEIAVRGAEPVVIEVRSTGNGPLVNPLLAESREPLALRWTGDLANQGIGAFLSLPAVSTAGELVQALANHHEPALAVGYVDARGAAGIQLAGALPDRKSPSGLLPVPARSPDFQWRGRLAAAALPFQRIRGGSGFEVWSDGRPSSDRSRGTIEWLWRSGERASRLEALLYRAIEGGQLELRSLAAAQADLRDERAGAVVTLALERAGDRDALPSQEQTIAGMLEDWDRSTAADSVGAAVYHVFLERLTRALFEPRMGREMLARYFALGRARPGTLVYEVLAASGEPEFETGWSDPERVKRAVEKSLLGAWLALGVDLGANRAKWTWGRLHELAFAPLWPRSGVGGVIGPLPYGGSDNSVLPGDYRPLESFSVSAVSSYRFLVDAGDPSAALTVLAPGQSEHPGHENAQDGLARWLPNRPSLLSLRWLAVEESAVAQLVLLPESSDRENP